MPLKKLLRDLKASLKKEKETKRKTQLGILWGKWKCKTIESRIGQLDRELTNRKKSTKKEEK
jgi:hypothetical protein